MKKIFSFAIAAMLLMAGCVKENISLNENGGKAAVTITATLPTNVEISRTGEANLIETISYVVYDKTMAKLVEGTLEVNGKHANLNLDLIKGETYNVAFWAQAEGATPFTFNAADATVEADYAAAMANSEVNDAFFAVVPELTIEGPVTKQVTMARPLAQINLGVPASELENAKKLGVEITKSQIKVTKVATKFDLFANKVSEREDVTFQMENLPVETLKVNGVEYAYLAYAYLLVEDTDATDLTYTLASDSKNIKEQTIPMVNFKRNHRTNILGRLITGNAGFDIEIDGGDIPDHELSDEAKLHLAMACDGSFTLSRDMQLTKPLVLTKGVEFTLDLGGHTISQENAQTGAYSMIENRGTLTLKNGTLDYADNATLTSNVNYVSNTIQNSGTLIIEEGVTVVNNSDLSISAYGYPHAIDNSGTLTINGGTFTNNTNYSSIRIWCTTDDNTVVTINGGTFNGSIDIHNVNGSANKGTLTINKGTFNADSYTNSAVRLLGFGTDVDEINAYIKGGTFNGLVKRNNYVSGEFNSMVFHISGGTFAEDPSEFVADGYKALDNGNGTWTVIEMPDAPNGYFVDANGVYQVVNADGLDYIAANIDAENGFEGKTIRLFSDVTLTDDDFTPIAAGSRSDTNPVGTGFKGVFDGANKTIDGLKIKSGDKNTTIGLFGIINGGEVKNVKLANVDINAPVCENAGAVAGLIVNGGKVSGVTVESGSVVAKRGNGGIVGRLVLDGTIENCTNKATISGTGANVGGIVGAAYYTKPDCGMTIKNCVNNGTVTGAAGGVGGIVGLSASDIDGCINNGDVNANGSSVGGIAGEQSHAGSVIGCKNSGNVINNSGSATGGIIGWTRYNDPANYTRAEIIEVTGNINSGNVTGMEHVGGIVGRIHNYAILDGNENNATNITATSTNALNSQAAGILGYGYCAENQGSDGMTDTFNITLKNNISTTAITNITAVVADLIANYDTNSPYIHLENNN